MHKILHLHNFICSNVVDFKWSEIILMMQTKVKMSLMRNHMALSLLVFLGRSSIDSNGSTVSVCIFFVVSNFDVYNL